MKKNRMLSVLITIGVLSLTIAGCNNNGNSSNEDDVYHTVTFDSDGGS